MNGEESEERYTPEELRQGRTYTEGYGKLSRAGNEGAFKSTVRALRSKVWIRDRAYNEQATELAIADAFRDRYGNGERDRFLLKRFMLNGDEDCRDSVRDRLATIREDARRYVGDAVLDLEKPAKIEKLKSIARNHEEFAIRREAAETLKRMAESDGNFALYYNPPSASYNRKHRKGKWFGWLRRH